MFTVSIETYFKASHQLRLPDGSREALHCHNWSVTAEVCSEKLNSMGLVMDFLRLKAMVNDITAELDDITLEKAEYFRKNNPSAENVAKYIYEKLEPKLPKTLRLDHIKVVEEPDCRAKFGK